MIGMKRDFIWTSDAESSGDSEVDKFEKIEDHIFFFFAVELDQLWSR